LPNGDVRDRSWLTWLESGLG